MLWRSSRIEEPLRRRGCPGCLLELRTAFIRNSPRCRYEPLQATIAPGLHMLIVRHTCARGSLSDMPPNPPREATEKSVLGFISGIEFGIQRSSQFTPVAKWTLRMIRYFFISTSFSIVIQLVRFNLKGDGMSTVRLIITALILWLVSLALVATLERRSSVRSGHVG
jgi:hypothetical protein